MPGDQNLFKRLEIGKFAGCRVYTSLTPALQGSVQHLVAILRNPDDMIFLW